MSDRSAVIYAVAIGASVFVLGVAGLALFTGVFRHTEPPVVVASAPAPAPAPPAAQPPHDRDQAEVAWAKGSAALEAGNTDEALADFDQATGFDDSFAEAFISKGNAHFAAGKLDAALNDYSDALQRDPNQPDAYLGRGMVYWVRGDLASAETAFAALVKTSPDDRGAVLKYVITLYDEGKKADVLNFYESQFQQNPNRDWIVAGLLGAIKSNAADERQGYTARRDRGQQIWDGGNHSNELAFSIGESDLKLGQYADAITWLSPLMNKDPNDIPTDATAELAAAYRMTGNSTACQDTWRQYMQRMGRAAMFDEMKTMQDCAQPQQAPAQ
ncbi:MAG: tetratricopeptide repeat protein [Rhizomicrobium sp.]|jgi:tetratricopeptide (TPR) repeat protein